jgi:hypothetical protein
MTHDMNLSPPGPPPLNKGGGGPGESGPKRRFRRKNRQEKWERPKPQTGGAGSSRGMHFEMELPGMLNWKFGSLDEAVNRTVRLMIRSVPIARIYNLNEDGEREGISLWLEKCGVACPSCLEEEAVVLMSGVPEKYDELAVCRKCQCSFKF